MFLYKALQSKHSAFKSTDNEMSAASPNSLNIHIKHQNKENISVTLTAVWLLMKNRQVWVFQKLLIYL